MSIEKINQGDQLSQSADLVNDNIDKLKELFPEIVTEGKIDFKVLQQVLGEELEEEEEYYRFTWAGKSQARREAHKPSTGTLRPAKEESLDWDTTENMYIEGDNLEVLKLLQKSYAKKIKMIYIDPPYNTGKDFVYKDNYKDNLKNYQEVTGQIDSEGNKLSTNSDSDGRFHSNWLNMMYPRLRLARNLLKEDGVIFVSISEEEIDNLKKLLNEVFGESNFRNCFISRRHDKNLNLQFANNGLKSFNVGFEYILCYSKSSNFLFNPIYKESSEERKNTGYWKGFFNDADRPTMRYDILGYTPPFGQWKWKQETALEAVENYIQFEENYSSKITLEEYWEQTGKKLKFIRRNLNGSGKNMGVENWIPPSEGKLRNTNLTDILTTKTEESIKSYFDYPKNIELLKLMIETVNKSDIILDFFAGSSSTAHAVIEKNIEDNGSRKYILVQLPEKIDEKTEASVNGFKTISDLGKYRIRKVCQKIKEQNPIFQNEKDLGFKVFKLDNSNIKSWDGNPENLNESLFDAVGNIKTDRTEEDVLYEILLKYGLDLTLPIEEKTIEGKKVFNVGLGSLFICLADGITSKVAEGIGQWKEECSPEICRVIFKDNGFTDVEKTNSVQTLKRYGINEIRSI